MTALTRGRMLALLGAPIALARCAPGDAVRVGSKNFTESIVIAEIYAQALERAHVAVQRRFNLGSTEIAMAAIRRGDIDLYPEYTGTALINVLHLAPIRDSATLYATVARAFAERYQLIWLARSPMNDSQALATTAAIARKRNLTTLSQAARQAPQLRLATIQEFLVRPDGLPGLQKFYGGFHFASVRTYDIALKYKALLDGHADVATAFSTDGAIVRHRLVVLRDDKHFWPAYNVAPVVRAATLIAHPGVRSALDAIAPAITDATIRRMNAEVEGGADPADVARVFLHGTR